MHKEVGAPSGPQDNCQAFQYHQKVNIFLCICWLAFLCSDQHTLVI